MCLLADTKKPHIKNFNHPQYLTDSNPKLSELIFYRPLKFSVVRIPKLSEGISRCFRFIRNHLNPLQGLITLHISCVPLTDRICLETQGKNPFRQSWTNQAQAQVGHVPLNIERR